MTKTEYRKLHRQLCAAVGNAARCEFCETKTAKRYEWALRKGHWYSNKKEDYMELCASCHRRYDYTDTRRENQAEKFMEELRSGKRTSKTMLGKFGADNPTSKPIQQLDKETGVLIKEYVSMTKASEDTGVLISALSQCLHEKTRSAGGFKWKYKTK